jgi:hypothetical protein
MIDEIDKEITREIYDVVREKWMKKIKKLVYNI